MTCPHCGVSVHIKFDYSCKESPKNTAPFQLDSRHSYGHGIYFEYCPNCEELVCLIAECSLKRDREGDLFVEKIYEQQMVYPKFPKNTDISEYVPSVYAKNFSEAEQVNNISPRASATLSRYLLQMILHEELKIQKRNLEEEISALETFPNMPSTMIIMLQAMRKVANFGAHPKKSTHTGEIIDVEQGEAEIMLELIQELFDVVFIKPKKQQEDLAAIQEKYGITL